MSTRFSDIHLNDGSIEWLKSEFNLRSDSELAQKIGIGRTTLSGIRNYEHGLGLAFVVGVYKAFGIGLDSPIYHISEDF